MKVGDRVKVHRKYKKSRPGWDQAFLNLITNDSVGVITEHKGNIRVRWPNNEGGLWRESELELCSKKPTIIIGI